MPARSVCLVTRSLSEAGPGRFGGQVSVTDIYHTIPLRLPPIMMLQINTVMLGQLASPGVRHSRVQQNTSGLPNVSTS